MIDKKRKRKKEENCSLALCKFCIPSIIQFVLKKMLQKLIVLAVFLCINIYMCIHIKGESLICMQNVLNYFNLNVSSNAILNLN